MKKRIIPAILLRGGTNVFLSQSFTPWRSSGALAQHLKLHVRRSCDELLIINTDQAGSRTFLCPNRIMGLIRQEVDVPISYLGGISSPSDAASCINAGFDKVYITSSFIDDPTLLTDIANVVGTQSIGVCLPYRRSFLQSASPLVWDFRTSSTLQNLTLHDALHTAVKAGAGEILLYDADRDGSLHGLDLSILPYLEAQLLSVPVLLAGGAGSLEHFCLALSSPSIQGVVASSIFSLTQETPTTIRAYCELAGIPMRRV